MTALAMRGCKSRHGHRAIRSVIGQFAANVDYDAGAASELLQSLETNTKCGTFDEEAVAAWERAFPGKLEPGERYGCQQECRNEPGHTASCSSAAEAGWRRRVQWAARRS